MGNKLKNLIFISIFILLSVTSIFSSNLTTSLIAYYTLDNSLLDSTGNGYTLTNNGSNYTTSGKINGDLK
jgi:hypothetical protein